MTTAIASDRDEMTQAEQHVPQWELIQFETKGWGFPISSWRITPQSGGSWTETVREEDMPYSEYSLVWRSIPAEKLEFSAIATILSKLPEPVPDHNECENFLPDMAYGTIRLTKGATTTEISWNSGCFDEDYRAFVAILKEADQAVAAKGRDGPVLRTERNTSQNQ